MGRGGKDHLLEGCCNTVRVRMTGHRESENHMGGGGGGVGKGGGREWEGGE